MRERVIKAYTDIRFPGSFGGLGRFNRYLKEKEKINISRLQLKDILEKVPVYQVHVLTKRRFPRRKLTAKGAGIDFHADLAYMPEYEGFKYFLLLVDLYSNYVYVVPLKDKSSSSVKKGFEKIFEDNFLFKFSTLGTDAGTEFTANRDYFKSRNIELYTRRGQNKAFQAENYIRIFKSALYKYLRFKRSQNWPDALPKIVDQLNLRRQKSLGPFTSEDINSPFNDPHSRELIRRKKAAGPSLPSSSHEEGLKEKDYVYVNFKRELLFKGFDTQRGAIFRIYRVDRSTTPFLYSLRELNGTKVSGHFYASELKKAPNPNSVHHEISEILGECKRRGRKELLVKWMHYPSK